VLAHMQAEQISKSRFKTLHELWRVGYERLDELLLTDIDQQPLYDEDKKPLGFRILYVFTDDLRQLDSSVKNFEEYIYNVLDDGGFSLPDLR